MKRLLILGAGIYQVPLIQKVREMGLEALVASYAGNYPGFAEADRSFSVDTTDAEGILAIARSEHVDGIMTTGTDVAVKSIGRVCDAMGLPGISEGAALLLTDKARMKQAFAKGGVNTSPFRVVQSEGEALEAAAAIGYPVMVKACDVSGSRGVTKVDEPDALPAAYASSMAATHADHVVVEGFVPGMEIGVDGFVSGGELVLFAPHHKFVRRTGAVTIPEGHAFPIDADEALLGRIRTQLERVVVATGMDSCAVNGDFMVAPDGEVYVLEAGGRCGATCIPELISTYLGIDYYEQMIRAALGETADFVPRAERPCMAKLLFSDVSGTVRAIDGAGLAEVERRFDASVGLDVAVGDKIHAVHDGTDRFGQVIMATDDEASRNEALKSVSSCIEVA